MDVRSNIIRAHAQLTRDANTTAYSVGDLMANSATAAQVTPLSIDLGVTKALIREMTIHVFNTAFPAGTTIRWHLFSQQPSYGVGDNAGAFPTSPGAGQIGCNGDHLGYFDITPDVWLTDRVAGRARPTSPDGMDIHFVSPDGASTKVWLVPEARSIWTPAASSAIRASLSALPA